MKLFHASLSTGVLKRIHELFGMKLNVLLSFAYIGRETKEYLTDLRSMMGELILDSGAWTASKGLCEIDVDQYISYLKLWGHHFDRYFNLDTDFRDCGFDNNIVKQIRMERAGLNPVPVVHNFFDDEIDYYLQRGRYDWLALGSSQATNFDAIQFAVERIKKGNPQMKIHWFGGSRYDWLIHLPIASCDTTSWAIAGKYGLLNYLNQEEGSDHVIYVGDYERAKGDPGFGYWTYPWREELDKFLSERFRLQVPDDLFGMESAFNRQVINAYHYAELERRINEERIRRGVPLE